MQRVALSNTHSPTRSNRGLSLRFTMPRPGAHHRDHHAAKARSAQDAGRDTTRVRLHHALAELGIASRRASEQLILQGSVQVNGKKITRLPAFIDPAVDRVFVNGREAFVRQLVAGASKGQKGAQGVSKRDVPAVLRKQYVMVYKPTRYLTSTADREGDMQGSARRTVADLVKLPGNARLFPVGRLEFHSSGLVLMTNDGDLANRLTHASFGVGKTYRVWLRGVLDDILIGKLERHLNKLSHRVSKQQGIRLDPATVVATVRIATRQLGAGEEVGEIDQRTGHRQGAAKTVIDITLTGGKGLKLAAMLTYLGVKVARIMQVAIGPLELKGLAPGEWRPLLPGEIRILKRAAQGTKKPGEEAASSTPAPKRPITPVAAPVTRDGDEEIDFEAFINAQPKPKPRPAANAADDDMWGIGPGDDVVDDFIPDTGDEPEEQDEFSDMEAEPAKPAASRQAPKPAPKPAPEAPANPRRNRPQLMFNALPPKPREPVKHVAPSPLIKRFGSARTSNPDADHNV